jgi:ubiquinone/menaquinone biosynthesis C-methylase UbiE
VRVAPAERLPFEADAFDVVLSQLVVNFMADAEAGIAEMRRVARRTVTSCVWDYAGEMTMLRGLRNACFRRLGAPHGPFTLSVRAWFCSRKRCVKKAVRA